MIAVEEWLFKSKMDRQSILWTAIITSLFLVARCVGEEFSCKTVPSNCSCESSAYGKTCFALQCRLSDDESLNVQYCPDSTLSVDCQHNDIFNNGPLSTFVDEVYVSPASTRMSAPNYSVQNCRMSNGGLDKVVRNVDFGSVRSLDVGKDGIGELSAGYFAAVAGSVERLSVTDTNYTSIDRDLVVGMSRLRELHLYGNGLTAVDFSWRDSSDLMSLDLSRNNITSLESDDFHGLSQLRLLHLWGNRISRIDDGVFDGVPNLQSLELSSNKLSTLSDDVFVPLKSLKRINLKSNKLSVLPVRLFEGNRNLSSIRLEQNKLASLSNAAFANFPSLENVNLAYNDLTSIPDDIFVNSTVLKTVDLSHNALTSIPERLFTDLTMLETLSLHDNKIHHIGKLLVRLPSLAELNLDGNELSALESGTLEGTNGLRKAIFGHNRISRIDMDVFSNKRELKELDLSHNELGFDYFLDVTPFNGCEELEVLDLSHNSITTVFLDFTLTKLRALDLSNNKVKSINTSNFQSTGQMRVEIDLRNNSIVRVDLDLVERMAKEPESLLNAVVRLDHNPLRCDCSSYDLLRYFNNSMTPEVRLKVNLLAERLTCAEPQELVGRNVKELKPDVVRCAVDECPEECSCSYVPHKQAILVDCAARNLSEVPVVPQYRLNRTEVYLQENFLKEMPRQNMGYDNATLLNVSHNHIEEITWLPSTLRVLDADNNNLTRLSDEILASMPPRVTLHRNPWTCDCQTVNFSFYLRDHVIPNKVNIQCELSGSQISALSESELCPTVDVVMLLLILVALPMIAALFTALMWYVYSPEIKAWLYDHNLLLAFITEEELDKDKEYDAFISYCHVDDDFVTKELVPKLEGEPHSFKLCIHLRNWVAGEFIAKQVNDSVTSSRRTIVVLSPDFLRSVWGTLEFRTAHTAAMREGRSRVIIILLGDIKVDSILDDELKTYLKQYTYIKYGEPWFWEKLVFALPHRGKNRANRRLENIAVNIDKMDLLNCTATPNQNASTPPAHPLLLKASPLDFRPADGVRITPPAESGNNCITV